MQLTDDGALLRQYVENCSDEAFAALVTRHINLVYSVALRHVGDPHHAEEITQAVFIILVKKARQLRHDKALSSWLFQATRLTAGNFVRSETRRHRREQEAYMQSTLNESGDDVWPGIAPLLDTAVAGLSAKDRQAIVLRFYEGRNLREVGVALGASEDAAEKRVTRAVERLRKFFTKRGVTLTAAAIAGAVSANSVQAAPVGLTAAVTAAAAKGTAVAASITTLVKGTMKIMIWLKLKFAIGVGAATLLAGGAATVAISQTGTDDKWSPQDIARQSQDAYAALSSYSDTGTVVAEAAGQTTTITFSIRLQRPNLYRIDWTQTGGSYTSKGVVWSDGSGDFIAMGAAGQEKNAQPQKMQNMQMALASATGVSGQAAAIIPGTFFNQNWGDVLRVPASGRSQLKKEGNEKVGGVDCCVFSSVIDPAKLPGQGKLPNNTGKIGTITTTLWIGKHDHLIHQTRQTMAGMSMTLPHQSDSEIKATLEKLKQPATPEAIAAWRAQMETALKQAQGVKFVFTQTHENIVVNKKFSAADFAR